jgi:hypothetical protein
MPFRRQNPEKQDEIGGRRGSAYRYFLFLLLGLRFPGWIGFSQWFRKEFGVYPPREMLVGLAKMGEGEREENTSFGAYLWENKKLV